MSGKNALGSTQVRKSIVEYVNIYEVTESELDTLSTGGQSSLCIDIAISLLSLAVTSIATLCTASFESDIAKNIFLFVAVLGVLGGVVLLIFGIKNRKSIKSVVSAIKDRMKDDANQMIKKQ